MKLLKVYHNGKSEVIRLHKCEAEDEFLRAACQELEGVLRYRALDGILPRTSITEYSIKDARMDGHYLNIPVFYMQKQLPENEPIYGPVLLAKKVEKEGKTHSLGFSEKELKALCRQMRIHPVNLRLHK